MTFVVAENSERRIGESDRPVGSLHDVIGRVQRFVVKAIKKHGDGPVMRRSCHATGIVLAGQQAPDAIPGVPFALFDGRLKTDTDPVSSSHFIMRLLGMKASGVAEPDKPSAIETRWPVARSPRARIR